LNADNDENRPAGDTRRRYGSRSTAEKYLIKALDSRRFQPDVGLPVRSKNPIAGTTTLILGISYAESEACTQQSVELFLTAAARDNAWNFFYSGEQQRTELFLTMACDRVISVLTPCQQRRNN
jgi:hypothetical protein